MNNLNCEREMNFNELMFVVLRQWRKIIVSIVIFSGLLGGYKLTTEVVNKNTDEKVENIRKTYRDELELYEKTKGIYELEIDNLKEKINIQENYFANSILMQISPYKKSNASVDLFIKTAPLEDTDEAYGFFTDVSDSILRAYKIAVDKINAIEDVEEVTIKSQYLQELITTRVDYRANVLNISVAYKDENGAKKILGVLLENLQSEYGEIQEKFGTHEIIVLNEISGSITDLTLAESQQMYMEFLTDNQSFLLSKEKDLEELTPPSLPTALSANISFEDSIRYGILGGVLGGFLAVFCICVRFLTCNELSSEKELKNRFGIEILGVFAQLPKKRMFAVVDGWINQLEGIITYKPSVVYEMIAIKVQSHIIKEKRICILGSVPDEKMREIAEELKKRIPEVEFFIARKMEHDTYTFLREISDAKQIIMVEERGQSRYKEIRSQIEVIQNLNKNIIGCIVL